MRLTSEQQKEGHNCSYEKIYRQRMAADDAVPAPKHRETARGVR